MSTGLMEQHTSPTSFDDDGKLTTGRWPSRQLGYGSSRRSAGHGLHVVLVKQLKSDRVTHSFSPSLQTLIAARHTINREQGAGLVIRVEDAIGVGYKHPSATL